jgi:cell division protein FtsB
LFSLRELASANHSAETFGDQARFMREEEARGMSWAERIFGVAGLALGFVLWLVVSIYLTVRGAP